MLSPVFAVSIVVSVSAACSEKVFVSHATSFNRSAMWVSSTSPTHGVFRRVSACSASSTIAS
ncbi:hypothetical protein [Caballeronia sp. NK8]|uniref:hypothetical protein n=1 Tax=Caballeronia sp. NK8 TaxID=140098 RepID=UPI003463C8EB